MQVIEWQNFTESGLFLNGQLTSVDMHLTAMTVGVFDGIHTGHKALLNRILSHKDKVPVVITFRKEKKRNEKYFNIISFNDKLAMFEKLGIQITVVIDFTDSFMRLPGKEFLDILLKSGSIGFFAAGNNFRCGYKLDTGTAEIKDYFTSRNIEVEVVKEVMEGDLPVSSSRIREAIKNGDVKFAEKLLGRSLTA